MRHDRCKNPRDADCATLVQRGEGGWRQAAFGRIADRAQHREWQRMLQGDARNGTALQIDAGGAGLAPQAVLGCGVGHDRCGA